MDNDMLQKNENEFLKELIRLQPLKMVVFKENGELFLSNMEAATADLLKFLRSEISSVPDEGEYKFIHILRSVFYNIKGLKLKSGSSSYYVFYLTQRRSSISQSHAGIVFTTAREVRSRFDSIYVYFHLVPEYLEKMKLINESTVPVMINGVYGTGKETLARMIYLESQLSGNPLVYINCKLLNKKGWDYLLRNNNSPLLDSNNTIIFARLEGLNSSDASDLLTMLSDMDTSKRNRMFFTCTQSQEGHPLNVENMYTDELSCLPFHVTPIARHREVLPNLAEFYLAQSARIHGKPVKALTPEAIELLTEYDWPHNLPQFKRIINELVLSAKGDTIGSEETAKSLGKEYHISVFKSGGPDASVNLDLNKPLNDINREVARLVIREAGGNQTLAAKSLGISRTTLWRLIKQN